MYIYGKKTLRAAGGLVPPHATEVIDYKCWWIFMEHAAAAVGFHKSGAIQQTVNNVLDPTLKWGESVTYCQRSVSELTA